MEEISNDGIGQRMIKVPAIEIIRKLRTKIDRVNFCRENSKNLNNTIDWYLPLGEPGFDVTFILQLIKGQKKVSIYLDYFIVHAPWVRFWFSFANF